MRLRERLQGIVPEERLRLFSDHYHVIGNIAVLFIPPEMDEYKKEIAKAVISQNKNIKTVLNKTSKLEGDKRIAKFELLIGRETVTLHREFGFIYKLDVSRVFFNSHLAYERHRLAFKAEPDEQVIVPFSGVGPFAVPFAAKGARVIALDKNREACRWLKENARLNGVQENLVPINADAFCIPKLLKQVFDKAVIPTPYGMDRILKLISTVVKKGGVIHFYTFKKGPQIESLIESYENSGFQVELHRRCGNVAPSVSRWVFDLVKCTENPKSSH